MPEASGLTSVAIAQGTGVVRTLTQVPPSSERLGVTVMSPSRSSRSVPETPAVTVATFNGTPRTVPRSTRFSVSGEPLVDADAVEPGNRPARLLDPARETLRGAHGRNREEHEQDREEGSHREEVWGRGRESEKRGERSGGDQGVGGTTGEDVEAMEGFAVLRAARQAGVPAVEIRAISNEIEEADRALWHFDAAIAAIASATPRVVHEVARCVI